ncbi:hypothetical protein ACFSTC_29570 [Nonomuraea ferruginea]
MLAALRRADEAAREVPPEFVVAGKAIFTWHDVDAELASLTYDSAAEREELSPTRGAEHVPLRALIFATGEVTIELEVGREALMGQVVPTGRAPPTRTWSPARWWSRRSTSRAASCSGPRRRRRSGCSAAPAAAPTW